MKLSGLIFSSLIGAVASARSMTPMASIAAARLLGKRTPGRLVLLNHPVFKFGALANFVSHSVVLGFTLGAAVVIALGQLPNALGLDIPSRATALDSLLTLLAHVREFDRASLVLALATLLVGVVFKRWLPRWQW